MQHQPQGVNVAADGNFFPGQLLRRHVGRRAVANLSAFHLPSERGESKIGD
jgi:hypothetical protein